MTFCIVFCCAISILHMCASINEHRYACISIKGKYDAWKTGHVAAIFRTCQEGVCVCVCVCMCVCVLWIGLYRHWGGSSDLLRARGQYNYQPFSLPHLSASKSSIRIFLMKLQKNSFNDFDAFYLVIMHSYMILRNFTS